MTHVETTAASLGPATRPACAYGRSAGRCTEALQGMYLGLRSHLDFALGSASNT
jgi:hypothetical protein